MQGVLSGIVRWDTAAPARRPCHTPGPASFAQALLKALDDHEEHDADAAQFPVSLDGFLFCLVVCSGNAFIHFGGRPLRFPPIRSKMMIALSISSLWERRSLIILLMSIWSSTRPLFAIVAGIGHWAFGYSWGCSHFSRARRWRWGLRSRSGTFGNDILPKPG
jgi:hypothetical protein